MCQDTGRNKLLKPSNMAAERVAAEQDDNEV